MFRGRRVRAAVAASATASLVALAAAGVEGAAAKGGSFIPLNLAQVPQPAGIDQYVRDQRAVTQLGKALFWDMQAGSDGRTACASCHYAAGADNRSRNQINPRGGAFTLKGPNAQLAASDFPIHTDDVVGSQGVVPSTFTGIFE